MERLTTPNYTYYSLDFMEDGISEMANKLSKYEDTGLTPEQILAMDEEYTKLAKELGEYKRLEEAKNHKPQTNADRIRNMTDEELAGFLCKVKADYQWVDQEYPSEENCGEWEEWLQKEVE